MAIYTILIAAVFIFAASNSLLDAAMIFCFITILILDMIVVTLYFIVPRFTVKKAKNLDTTIEYTFNDKDFQINAQGPHANESSNIKYSILHNVVKTEKYLYLFLNRINALIVDISDLTYDELYFIKSSLSKENGSKKVKWKI